MSSYWPNHTVLNRQAMAETAFSQFTCYGEINGTDICESKDKAESQEKQIKTCISKPYYD